jgi:hypothetical protein
MLQLPSRREQGPVAPASLPHMLDQVTSVKVVEKRVSEEVAIGQAAMGGSFG